MTKKNEFIKATQGLNKEMKAVNLADIWARYGINPHQGHNDF